jgi:protein-S-isoprenylcysteine O-methyltransferase Ste14
MSEKPIISEGVEIKSVKRLALIRVSVVFIIIGIMFFLPAGTLNYWQGWVYMIVIAIPMIFFGVYLFKHDPKLLERRMRIKEKREKQKLIVKLGILPFLLAFIVPGFDRRFGWSEVSLPVTILGLALVLFGYLMTLYVFKTNTYASRVVEVEKEQKVITTGPYALVRHPMYSFMIIFYLFTPLALGSYWAVIPALSIIPVLVVRIGDEEKELLENLEGYREYTQKVKHRLIPGVW